MRLMLQFRLDSFSECRFRCSFRRCYQPPLQLFEWEVDLQVAHWILNMLNAQVAQLHRLNGYQIAGSVCFMMISGLPFSCNSAVVQEDIK